MRIAAIDLGSNSFHLVVVEAHADGRFETLVRDREMLRLGDVVARHGRITEEAGERAVATMRRFRSVADGAGAVEIVACATSAIREAENSSELVERIIRDTGVPVQVISGRDEARLVFNAVQASVLLSGPTVCFDLGGGSLEVSVGDQRGLIWSTSVKLGVARLTAELVGGDPPSDDDLRRVDARVREVLGPVAAEIDDLGARAAVGTSGTLCDIARMLHFRRTGVLPVSINQSNFTRDELVGLHRDLAAMPADRRRKVRGLDARRADLIVTGTQFLVTTLELFGHEQMTVGEWALREGMILDAIGHHDTADWGADPHLIRRTSVLDVAQRCGWDEGHGTQVAALAVQLFDETLPLHRLPHADRELLEYGALLHDIGEHVGVSGHHKHTGYLIEHGRLRGFTPDDVAVLAALGRFHRSSGPKASYEPYGSMSAARRDSFEWLLGLLRLADGLDRGRAAAVDGVSVLVRDDGLVVEVASNGDVELELWGGRRKRELLERKAGRPVRLVVADRGEASTRDRSGRSAAGL